MPLITISIAIVVTFGLIKFAVPQFTSLFKSLGGTLPLPTRILIGVSDFMQGWTGWFSIIMVVVLTLGFKKLISTKKGKIVWDRIKLKLPLFGNLILKRSIMSFASTLSLLLRSGVDYLTALDIVKNTAGNEVIRNVLESAQQSINRGEHLSGPLVESGIFPPLVTQMIRSGEQTGKIDDMLGKLAILYEREVDQTVEDLSKALEPMLTIIMGALIGGVLLGLYMPMFKAGEFISGSGG
jgi:type IV pilus assembly protein PilC